MPVNYSELKMVNIHQLYDSVQCFDAIGLAAEGGGYLACKKLSGGMMAWLSVWGEDEVQICIWLS